MALFTNVEEGRRPAILLLSFSASTGYILPDDKRLFHNQTKCNDEMKRLMKEARQRNAAWAEASILELFRDKDTGLYLPGVGNANMSMSFGKKPG